MSKSQRTKGAGGERELCALLTELLGQKVTRKLGQARDSGHDIDLGPFRIEAKRRARVALLYDAMDQAAAAYDETGSLPVVAVRADGKPWLMVMYATDWVTLAREEIVKHEQRKDSA